MSISNYAELQTAIGNYLHRSGLASQIPDFITLAEAKLNRQLRLRAMEQVATGAVAATVAVPSRFAEVISMRITNSGDTAQISYSPSSRITGDDAATAHYSIIGDNFYFDPVDTGATYSLHYYQKFAALSAGVNWLITNAPDIYLYASLMESAPYIKEDTRIPVWAQLLSAGIEDLRREDRESRYGNNMRMVPA